MRVKIDRAREYLEILDAYSNKYKQEKNELLIDSIVLNYNRFHSCIKDILIEKAHENDVEYDNTEKLISLFCNYPDIIKQFTSSDELMYDYINSEYYDTLVLNLLLKEDTIMKYKEVLNKIENCKTFK